MVSCSIFLCAALENTLGKVNIPYLALPFNLIAVCTFLTIQPQIEVPISSQESQNSTEIVNWCLVGRGIVVSMGQVYALNHVEASILMNLAVLLASPLLFFMSSLGAVIGSIAGNFRITRTLG